MNYREDNTNISVVYLCHDGNGNFVLAKRSMSCRDEHETWDNGAGKLEFGDTVEETLRKEILEEYCVDVITFDFLGYRDVHREHDGKKTHWVALDFLVEVDRQKVAIGEPDKFDDIGWFRLNSLPSPLHSQLPVFLEKYKDLI